MTKEQLREFEKDLIKTGLENVQNIVLIKNGATNEDIIKVIFPNIQISDSEIIKNVYTGIPYGELIGANIDCMREWWKELYER